MKEYLKLTAVVIVCLFAGAYLHKCQSSGGIIAEGGKCEIDTLKTYDTIRYVAPKPKAEMATGITGRYKLPTYYFIGGEWRGECGESGVETPERRQNDEDSAIVELPIIQRHYADSTYEAWVSGPIDPRLDSLRVFGSTTTITKREWKPPKRWHFGPTIGYGYTPQGFQPYIGVSITYSIISW